MGTEQQSFVVVTPDQLRELVQDAIVIALQQYVASQPDPLRALKAREMAARLSISQAQLSILVEAGLPFIPIGVLGRRFDPIEVERWLRSTYRTSGPAQGGAARPAGEPAPGPVKAPRHPIRRRGAPSAA